MCTFYNHRVSTQFSCKTHDPLGGPIPCFCRCCCCCCWIVCKHIFFALRCFGPKFYTTYAGLCAASCERMPDRAFALSQTALYSPKLLRYTPCFGILKHMFSLDEHLCFQFLVPLLDINIIGYGWRNQHAHEAFLLYG